MKTAIQANYDTRTEHKVTFLIDGKKYGFRCSPDSLRDLEVESGQTIPYVTTFSIWELN